MDLDDSDSSTHEDSSMDMNDILGEMQTHETNGHLQRQASLATIDVAYSPDGEEVDIDTFKENCWEYICSAQKEGGIAELASKVAAADNAAAGKDGDINSIKVGVRTRPINDREIRLGTRGCIEHLNDGRNVIVRKYNWNDEPYDMSFAFDHAFDEDSTQDEVFKAMGWTALRNAFSGYNVSIFAYGQTGSGKSHSMIGTEDDPGLIRRIGEFLFDFIERGTDELGYSYSATVSAAEIYCENVRDLLVFMGPNNGGGGGSKNGKKPPKRVASLTSRLLNTGSSKAERMNRELSSEEQPTIQYDKNGMQMLKIREGKDGVYVEGQSKVQIRTMAEMGGIIFAAIENRMTRSTNMNADSSRSHLIFTIEFTQTQVSSTTGRQSHVKSKINLIDLAGSERARSTGASGAGLREGANINKSLSTLGRVISTLAEGGATKGSKDHIPYRDSKLTYILKDSLGGDSKTAMLATISPSESNYEETVSTLRYAASVKRIKTSASQHLEQEAGEMIEKLRAEVDALAQELKNQEIQAEALTEEHRLALAELEKSRPTKVVKDDREVAKLKAELGAMSKRAERYRTERDVGKKEMEAMEKRADRYRKERKVAEDKVRQLEKDLSKAEKLAQEKITQSHNEKPKQIIIERPSSSLLVEPSTPTIPAAVTAEMKRLNERVKELENMVTENAGLGEDVIGAIKNRRETGSHLDRMSLELESTTLEKLKLEQKLKKSKEKQKENQMKDPLAVMSMGFSSMFGAAIGNSVAEVDSDEEDSDDDHVEQDEAFDLIEEIPRDERGISGEGGSAKRAGGVAAGVLGSFDSNGSNLGSFEAKQIESGSDSTENKPLRDESVTTGRATSRLRRPDSVSNNSNTVLVETLRHQVEDANALNEALEKKITDQHNTMKKMSESLASLQNNQQENSVKALGEGEANAALQKATWDKANKEIADLAHKLMEAEAKVEHDISVKTHLENRLKESDRVEQSLRKAKDELMLAKDNAEDELRSLGAQRAEDNRVAAEKLELAETLNAKLEKSKAKLERELEKLQKRHAELRAASKRLLAEKMEKKANTPPPQRPEGEEGGEAPAATTATTSGGGTAAAPVPLSREKDIGARSRSPRPAPPTTGTDKTGIAAPIANTGFQPAGAPPSRKGASPSRTRSPRLVKTDISSKTQDKEPSSAKDPLTDKEPLSAEPLSAKGKILSSNGSFRKDKSPSRSRSPRVLTNTPSSGALVPTSTRPKVAKQPSSDGGSTTPPPPSSEVEMNDNTSSPRPKPVNRDKSPRISRSPSTSSRLRPPPKNNNTKVVDKVEESVAVTEGSSSSSAPPRISRMKSGEKSVERKRAPRTNGEEVKTSRGVVPVVEEEESKMKADEMTSNTPKTPPPVASKQMLNDKEEVKSQIVEEESELSKVTKAAEELAAKKKRAEERERKLKEAKEKSNKIKLEREAKALEAKEMEMKV